MSGEARSIRLYREFLDAVRSKSDELSAADLDELTTVEGVQWLIEFSTMLLEVFTHRDPAYPVMMPITTHFRRFMGDHSLGVYNYVTELDPAFAYRLWCRPGDAVFHSVTVQGGRLPLGSDAPVLGKLNHKELVYEQDGTFAVTLSAEEQPGNWISLAGGSASLLTREFFYSWPFERTEAVWRIENLTSGTPARPDDTDMADALQAAIDAFARNTARYPLPVGQALFAQGGLNNFGELIHFSESNMPTWGNLDAFHTTMPYELEPDEAIVIEGGRAVECSWWGITQNNRYIASFGLGENVNLPGGKVALETDGTWRAVLGAANPGTSNWISTAGHRHGIVRIRWLVADDEPARPRTTKVKVDSLRRGQ
jgi:hypothetical protein